MLIISAKMKFVCSKPKSTRDLLIAIFKMTLIKWGRDSLVSFSVSKLTKYTLFKTDYLPYIKSGHTWLKMRLVKLVGQYLAKKDKYLLKLIATSHVPLPGQNIM